MRIPRNPILSKITSAAALFGGVMCFALTTQASSSNPPLEWQKVQLEDRLQERISKAVGNSLPGEQFFVTVTIDLLPKPETPEKPAAAKPPEKKKLQADDDIIPLGKLDLEAPYIAPEAVTPTVSEQPVVDSGPNIFDFIRQINASVYIDNGVSDVKKEFLKQITTRILGGMGKNSAIVSVDKADLALKKPAPEVTPTPKAPEAVVEQPWTPARIATEFKMPISLVLISLIICVFLGLFGTLFFRSYRNLESRRLGLLEAKEAREQDNSARNPSFRENASFSNAAAPTQTVREEIRSSSDKSSEKSGASIDSYAGLGQLRDILQAAPDRAALVISQIIKDTSPVARDTLNYLSRHLKVEEFHDLAKRLSIQERQEWKKHVGKDFGSGDENKIGAYLATQVAEDVLGGLQVQGNDFAALLNEVTLPAALDVATNSVELGAVLMNIVSSSLAARLFTLLPIERANEITTASVSLSSEKIGSLIPKLRQTIQSTRSGKTDVPFIHRAVELLRTASPQKESAIFGALAMSENPMILEAAAREHFPSELITQIPTALLKDFLNEFPGPKRAEIIASRPDRERKLLLNALGENGSKSREMMELDIEQMLSSELSAQRLERNRENLWKNVSEQFRNLIKRDENVAENVENVLSDWLNVKLNRAPVRIGGQRAA